MKPPIGTKVAGKGVIYTVTEYIGEDLFFLKSNVIGNSSCWVQEHKLRPNYAYGDGQWYWGFVR